MTQADKPAATKKETAPVNDRETFKKSLFTAVYAQLAGRGIPAGEAAEQAKVYAEIGATVDFD